MSELYHSLILSPVVCLVLLGYGVASYSQHKQITSSNQRAKKLSPNRMIDNSPGNRHSTCSYDSFSPTTAVDASLLRGSVSYLCLFNFTLGRRGCGTNFYTYAEEFGWYVWRGCGGMSGRDSVGWSASFIWWNGMGILCYGTVLREVLI